MILIGITGPIGHGKSTFAGALAELEPTLCHLESNMPVIEVANNMHAVLKTIPDPYDVEALNGWLQSLPAILLKITYTKSTFEQIKLEPKAIEEHPVDYQKLLLHVENLQRDRKLAQTPITAENKGNYRPFLQWLGGYLVAKADPGIWYNEIVRRAQENQQKGCKLCIVGGLRYPSDANILRSAGGKIIKVYRPGHLQSDMMDPTERERDNIQVDSTIMSTGSVDDLKRCAAKFYDDLRNDTLQKIYQTKGA